MSIPIGQVRDVVLMIAGAAVSVVSVFSPGTRPWLIMLGASMIFLPVFLTEPVPRTREVEPVERVTTTHKHHLEPVETVYGEVVGHVCTLYPCRHETRKDDWA